MFVGDIAVAGHLPDRHHVASVDARPWRYPQCNRLCQDAGISPATFWPYRLLKTPILAANAEFGESGAHACVVPK